MSEADERLPVEIWVDINGNATRTQFKGGVKYIRADERDRLREALEQVVYHLAQPGEDESLANQYVPTIAETLICQRIIEAALKLAGQRRTPNETTE